MKREPSPIRDEYAPVIFSQETVSYIESLDMMSGEVALHELAILAYMLDKSGMLVCIVFPLSSGRFLPNVMKEDCENILRARAIGKAVLTSPFRLLGSHHLGVVLMFPVYKSKLPSKPTKEERIQATAGLVWI